MADAGPGGKFKAVTPDDDTDLVGVRAVYVGTGGSLVVDDTFGNSNVTFANVPDGTLLPICAKRIKEASTAADLVVIQLT